MHHSSPHNLVLDHEVIAQLVLVVFRDREVRGQQLTANGHTAEAVKHPRDPDYTRIQVKVGLFGKQKGKHSKIRAFLHAVGGRLGQDSLVPEFPGAK